jgi:SpoVK/Ycf46/Vps4 family AAA+-type ATPase
MLKKSGLLQLHRGAERFDNLGGLQSLKSFCLRAMRRQGHHDPLRRPRGVMLLGVPGTGKSAFSKALGAETGRPTLVMDVGALMGSLVGSTEANIRQALKIADAMAPCVLMVDEVEKALSGVANSPLAWEMADNTAGGLISLSLRFRPAMAWRTKRN